MPTYQQSRAHLTDILSSIASSSLYRFIGKGKVSSVELSADLWATALTSTGRRVAGWPSCTRHHKLVLQDRTVISTSTKRLVGAPDRLSLGGRCTP